MNLARQYGTTGAAREIGVSRQTACSWLSRYEAGGGENLRTGPRGKAVPRPVTPAVRARLLALKEANPRRSAAKAARVHAAESGERIHRSAAWAVLNKGLAIKPLRHVPHFSARAEPNALWQVDLIEDEPTAVGKVQGIVSLDDHSRTCVGGGFFAHKGEENVLAVGIDAVTENGLPVDVLSGNWSRFRPVGGAAVKGETICYRQGGGVGDAGHLRRRGDPSGPPQRGDPSRPALQPVPQRLGSTPACGSNALRLALQAYPSDVAGTTRWGKSRDEAGEASERTNEGERHDGAASAPAPRRDGTRCHHQGIALLLPVHHELTGRDAGGRRDCLLGRLSVRGKPNLSGHPTIRLECERIPGNAQDNPAHRRGIASARLTARAWCAVGPSTSGARAYPALNLPGFQNTIAFVADRDDRLAGLDAGD